MWDQRYGMGTGSRATGLTGVVIILFMGIGYGVGSRLTNHWRVLRDEKCTIQRKRERSWEFHHVPQDERILGMGWG
jgi:hypothetical protein